MLSHVIVLDPEDVSELERQLDCGATLVIRDPGELDAGKGSRSAPGAGGK